MVQELNLPSAAAALPSVVKGAAATDASGKNAQKAQNQARHNPFRIPPDEAIFTMRKREKDNRKQYEAEMRNKPVAAKSTFASRMAATVPVDSDSCRKGPTRLPATAGNGLMPHAAASLPAEAEQTLATAASPGGRRQMPQRVRMADFIAKKREIFLVQMSLDVKRAEIRKLEQRILQREDALKNSEEMLESDAIKFDQFLRDNEAQVNAAIRDAEGQAKKRQDRQVEIKRLNGSIAAARSQLNKAEEHLAACHRFQEFLDSITPSEHFEAARAEQERKRAAAEATWQAQCECVRQAKVSAAKAKDQAELDYVNACTQQEADRAAAAIKTATQNLAEALASKEPPKPPDAEPPKESDAPPQSNMYFVRPEQLLQILANLEEQNLFLIQNTQEVEEARDALEATFKKTQERMNVEVEGLQATITQLEAAIAQEESNVELLRARSLGCGAGGPLMFSHSVSLTDLAAKVELMYRRCGFDVDPSASTLQMLTNIEMRLEDYLKQVKGLPEEVWESAEKARERERRFEARDAKIQATKEEQERRLKKALERAAAPVFKKTGRPIMFRSLPARKAKPVKVEQRDDDEIELEMFLAREMLC